MIIISPDKFKGSLNSDQVSLAMLKAVEEIFPNKSKETIKLADGGEGTAEILGKYFNSKQQTVQVSNPVFVKTNANYYINKKERTAFIDISSVSGLGLLTVSERNPLLTSSFGTGELILDALNQNCKLIYLCLGGSATTDAGIGIASALGFKFLNKKNEILPPIGSSLLNIYKIDSSDVNKNINKVSFKALCDVSNKLYGSTGAAKVYSAQKGANSDQIVQLDSGLKHFSEIIKKHYNFDISKLESGGAAGGVGAGLKVFFNAELLPGFQTVVKLTNFENRIKDAELILSGEGKLDKQTLSGKLIKGISGIAKEQKIKFGVICGSSTLTKSKIDTLNINFLRTIESIEKNIDLDPETSFQNVYKLTLDLLSEYKKTKY